MRLALGELRGLLIPAGILGANVSGLISRSIPNDAVVGPGDFHAVVRTEQPAHLDQSRRFVYTAESAMLAELPTARVIDTSPDAIRAMRRVASDVILRIAEEHAVENRNRIKPGIAEATSVVLRRAPQRVFVTSTDAPDLAGLVRLAEAAGVPVETRPGMMGPYRGRHAHSARAPRRGRGIGGSAQTYTSPSGAVKTSTSGRSPRCFSTSTTAV